MENNVKNNFLICIELPPEENDFGEICIKSIGNLKNPVEKFFRHQIIIV